MMNDTTNKVSRREGLLGSFSFSLGAILLGVLLILSSLLPMGDLATRSQWTDDDAKSFALLSEEYHRSDHPSSKTSEPLDVRHEKLKDSFEAMRKKLEHARQQPRRWGQYLLWSGALLTALGAFSHLTARK